jgi:hypothetical protein
MNYSDVNRKHLIAAGVSYPALPSLVAYISEDDLANFCMLRPYSSSMIARFLKNIAAS